MPKSQRSKRNGRKSNKVNKMKKMKGGSAWQFVQSVYGSPDTQQSIGVYPNGGTSNMIAINQSGGGLTPLTPDVYSDQMDNTGAVLPNQAPGVMMGGGDEEKLMQTPAIMMGGNEEEKLMQTPPVMMGGNEEEKLMQTPAVMMGGNEEEKLMQTPAVMMGGNEEEKLMQTPAVMMGGNVFVPLQPAVYNDSTLSEQGNSFLNTSSASAATNVLSNYNTTMGGAATAPPSILGPVKVNGTMSSPYKVGIMGGKLRGRKGGNVLSEIAVPATLLIANEFVKNRKGYATKKNINKKNGKGKMYSRRRRFNRR